MALREIKDDMYVKNKCRLLNYESKNINKIHIEISNFLKQILKDTNYNP